MARQKRLRGHTASPGQPAKRSRHQQDNARSDHQFTLPAQPQTPLGMFWASSGAAGASDAAQHTRRCSCSDAALELSLAQLLPSAVSGHNAAGAAQEDDSDTQDTASSSSSEGGSTSSGATTTAGGDSGVSRGTSAGAAAGAQQQQQPHPQQQQQQQHAEDDSITSGQPPAPSSSSCFSFGVAPAASACSPDDDASSSLLLEASRTLEQWDLIGDLAGCLLELAQA